MFPWFKIFIVFNTLIIDYYELIVYIGKTVSDLDDKVDVILHYGSGDVIESSFI